MRQIHSSLQNMPGSWQWQLFHGCTICCSLGVTGYLLFMVHFFFLAKWLPNPWGPLWQSCVASPDVNTYANRYFHENSLANLSVPMELWYFSWMQLLLAEVFPSIRRKAQVNKTKQNNCFLPSVLKKVAVVEIYELTRVFGKMGRPYGFS